MILKAVIATARTRGGAEAVSDATGATRSYRQLLLSAYALSLGLRASGADAAPFVGVMLPTSTAAAVTFLALHAARRTPAMLNFTAGERSLKLACEAAGLTHVITSRAFLAKAKLESLAQALPATLIYLEEVRERITWRHKLAALFRLRRAHKPAQANDPAAILFTSGSEGAPKGVALSHANLLANIAQAAERFHFGPQDAMFNALPVFHSFGLMAGTLLPLVLGFRTYLYPTPLHYSAIPPLVRETRASILLGTDTFLNGYARYAASEDFAALRLVVAGAEKLQPATSALYRERYGIAVMEGYGVTEASPVIAVNTPQEHKQGTVGRLMPGMACRIEKVEGLSRGGRLFVRGPNIMLGYLGPDVPGHIVPQAEWYDTGDIAELDAEGYLTILGRARRFAKMGGEMVSLAHAEAIAASLWPDFAHAAVAAPDARKGERILLLSECNEATREAMLAQAKTLKIPEIALPRAIVHLPALPRLGNGKIDYLALQRDYCSRV